VLRKLLFSSTLHNLLYVQKNVIKALERVWFRTCAPVGRAGGKMALSCGAGRSWKDRSRTGTAAGEPSKLEYDPGGGGGVGKWGRSVGCPSSRSGVADTSSTHKNDTTMTSRVVAMPIVGVTTGTWPKCRRKRAR